MVKKISVILLVLITVLITTIPGFAFVEGYVAKGRKVCTNPADMLNFVCCEGHETAPIRIVRGTLKRNGISKKIYLVGLVGVELNIKQENNFFNTIPSAVSVDNNYTKLIKKVLKENVPKGANIVFCGHSLGGMVAQQIIADKQVKDDYNIISTLTAGSPYIIETGREGELHRICDTSDAVPYLSAATFVAPYTQFTDREVVDGGFYFKPDSAHNISYFKPEIWNEYDALGVKGGNASITFNYSTLMQFGKV